MPPAQAKRRPPILRLARAVTVRPRLMLAVAVGIAILIFAPAEWRIATRMLIAWDVATCLYLVLAVSLMVGADVKAIREQAIAEDEGRATVLVLTAVAALASLGAIIAEIGTVSGGGDHSHAALVLSVVTILLSWSLIHVVFAIHYAHDFYDAGHAGMPQPLNFPHDPEPVYSDFLYFAFVIGMTAQVSDVSVRDKDVRRTVTGHAIVSFFFNAALLALVVNIAASAI